MMPEARPTTTRLWTSRIEVVAGGAWRAFASVNEGPGKLDPTALEVAYDQLPQCEKERLQAKGAEATRLKRHLDKNEPPFGATQKQLRRQRNQMALAAHDAMARMSQADEPQADVHQLGSRIAAETPAWKACASTSRVAQRGINRSGRKQRQSSGQRDSHRKPTPPSARRSTLTSQRSATCCSTTCLPDLRLGVVREGVPMLEGRGLRLQQCG